MDGMPRLNVRKYDDLEWHVEDAGNDRQLACAHMGVFLAWALIEGHTSTEFDAELSTPVEAVRSRRMSGTEFLLKYCDGKLTSDCFGPAFNRFVKGYYEGSSQYFADYGEVIAPHGAYEDVETWELYERIAGTLSARFESWHGGR
ncbi:hypothetical protein GCM10025865_23590 [Paraoerskovia sediminicola]|uniref:DUF7832 domain-containing protein n=1 Tax=Paraoerskovia sediminicola TaxID=1138587 RepID=A0ABN6XED2_9CELL|nr:hypothetical protein GCM10025865_23590 [Paraoerskovia sediminicola]